jgi:valyl-tRNA synthetase
MSPSDFPKNFQPAEHEAALYKVWEESGAFHPNLESEKEPFSILMPPPNANASLHAGHGMFVIQDILVRFKRMQGHPTVWFPGTDHAGYETQFVYEKYLKKEGKSRFQFDRETLYKDIATFVNENSGFIYNQMRALGFSADWEQTTFTLDEKVLKIVMKTFEQLEKDGLIYRDNYLVNYCPKCGTTFADLEVEHEERVSPLYYVRYRFSDGEPRVINGQELHSIVVATVRPETIFADAAIALHPSDPRAEALNGEFVLNPLTRQPIPIILDEYVDPEFGTGALKITPAHDPNDFKLGKKHNLPLNITINTQGKIDLSWLKPDKEPQLSRAEQLKEQFQNMGTVNARAAVIKLLEAENSVEKIDEKYTNQVTVCYKAKHPIEPLPYPNWFVKMELLAKLGLSALKTKEVEIIPKRFNSMYTQWLENIRDWPISRQIVWGIRMPVWYNALENQSIEVSFLDKKSERHTLTIQDSLSQGYTLEEISSGLQTLTAPMNVPYIVSTTSPGADFIQETDTFDTWFSSGQWPLVVLGYPDGENFKRFYPTSVMDSMWDILFFWVARMIMLGKYLTKSVEHPEGISPFKTVYLHSMVTDAKGTKMSKSKGNVVNPLEIIEKFGADALRIALVAGSAPGNPIALSEPKIKGYRNFANKIWNIGRFVWMKESELGTEPLILDSQAKSRLTEADVAILQELSTLTSTTTELLERYRFSDAALGLYEFIWNRFANDYLENNKSRGNDELYIAVVKEVLRVSLQLLHPFMPFITEAVWQELWSSEGLLIVKPWPKA